MNTKPIIIIYGPTAVGKTAFVESLAQYLPLSIINMDVGQFYAPLTIGTAKPDWKASPIPHYLFDMLSEPKDYTVYSYRNAVGELIPDIEKQGRIPTLVGGSGFYLRSLLFPPQAPSSQPSREKERMYSWELLQSIDPERAADINPSDPYRIKRALDIWYETGKKPSSFISEYNPPAPFILIYLERERDELYQRIDQRVVDMMNHGWVDEVKKLKSTEWEQFFEKKGLIGYSEIAQSLDAKNPIAALQAAIPIIQQKTRHYAKRQMTFFRMLIKLINDAQSKHHEHSYKGSVHSVNLTLMSHDLYIKRLIDEINNYLRNT